MCSELSTALRCDPLRLAMIGYGAGWAHAGGSVLCDALEHIALIEV
jgi:hypothetical protein